MPFINKFVILCVAVQVLLVSHSLVQAQFFNPLRQVAQTVQDGVDGTNFALSQALDTVEAGVDIGGNQLGGTPPAVLIRGLAGDYMAMKRGEIMAPFPALNLAMRGMNSINSFDDINPSNGIRFGQDGVRVTSETGLSILQPVSSMANRVSNFGLGRL